MKKATHSLLFDYSLYVYDHKKNTYYWWIRGTRV